VEAAPFEIALAHEIAMVQFQALSSHFPASSGHTISLRFEVGMLRPIVLGYPVRRLLKFGEQVAVPLSMSACNKHQILTKELL